MILHQYNGDLPFGANHSLTRSDTEPGLSEYAAEAWERMVGGGCEAYYNIHGDVIYSVGGLEWFWFAKP